MARTSARQRRLAKARPQPGAAVPPVVEEPTHRGLTRFLFPACLVVITPALVAIATRDDHTGAWSAGIRLTVAAALFQSAIVAASALRRRPADADGARPSSPLIAMTAVLAGAALVATATIPVAAWFAGLGMFVCFLVDAAIERKSPFGWALVPFGIALLCCWVFAGAQRWDNLLWWSFAFAAFAAMALNSASPAHGDNQRWARRSLGGALAGVGLLCSAAAIVIAWRSPGAAILIAIEGTFALLLTQRAARRFGLRGVFGVAAAASILASIVFLVAL